MITFTIKPLSDQSLLLQWEGDNSIDTHQQVMGYHSALKKNSFPGFIESVPAGTSLAVYYNPLVILETNSSAIGYVTEQLRRIRPSGIQSKSGNLHTIPVHYGGISGPDLEEVAFNNGISEQELVRLHTAVEYTVIMMGFMPGFPYLGFTHEKLYTERKSTPRLQVPAGSVALAGNQTGIYPTPLPGGWQIIGQTTTQLFDADQHNPCLFQTGDRVKFVAIT